jgi:DnaJ-class molecular chaperone
MIVGETISCPLCDGTGELVYAAGPGPEDGESFEPVFERVVCPSCYGAGTIRECRCAACGSPVSAASLAAWDMERLP